jgi:glutamine synthetase
LTRKIFIEEILSMTDTHTNQEYILKSVADQNIEFISLWFTDILGMLKQFTITADELEDVLETGANLDGSSITGFADIEDSDLLAVPDLDTFRILPWEPYPGVRAARFFCDIKKADGSPFDGDPRNVLRRALQRAEKMGFTFYVGPELEYFYFQSDLSPAKCLDSEGYFGRKPDDIGRRLRKETVMAMQAMGIQIETLHHEVAESQHEIDMKYAEGLIMADQVMTFRFLVKEVAGINGYHATFMPKPIFGVNGSGMHMNMSLFRSAENAFYDEKSAPMLSSDGLHFVAGLLKHAREVTAVTNQWVNSYKRLTPGYEAPIYISWSVRNRSALVRIPACKPGRHKSTRVEYRAPDPACNPYLAFAVLLHAGLDGIENRYEVPEPTNINLFHLTDAERSQLGIHLLPGTLEEALRETADSRLVQKALGDHIFHRFLELKRAEWDDYRVQVTDYELKKYLPIL